MIAGSKVFHAAAIAAAAVQPDSWPWAVGAVAANQLALFAAVMSPRSQWLGQNLARAALPGEVVLTFDDGPDPVLTPAVLDILAAYGAQASFFCIGERARRHPALVRRIIAEGHAVENHSDRHLAWFACLGPRGLRGEIQRAQDSLADLSGIRPRFFRAPMGFRSPFLDQVLGALALRHVAWTRRGFDTVDRDAQSVLRRLVSGLAAGDILLLHDGRSAQTLGEPVLLRVLPALLQHIRAAGLRAVSLVAIDAPGGHGDGGPLSPGVVVSGL